MVIGCIVAGGKGERMGHSSVPKQFLTLGTKPIIVHTIEKFLSSGDIDYVIVGVNPCYLQFMEDVKNKYFKDEPNLFITNGGSDRNETIAHTVAFAKAHLSAEADAIMITHDAVRPFVSLEILSNNVMGATEFGVCDTVVSATDTIVCSSNQNTITDIPLREEIYQGQTPQSFQLGLFEKVYSSMTPQELQQATDVCKLFFLRGYEVKLIQGSLSNFKVTYPHDLKIAKIMMGENA